MKKWRAAPKPVSAPLDKRDGQPPNLEFLSVGAARDAGSRQSSLYSRFVRVMRLILPAAAALLLGAILLWPQLQAERTRFQIGLSGLDPRNPDRLRVLNARFRGTDKDNQPYTVTAESASEADSQGRTVALDSPSADLALPSGAWVLARAPEGIFDRDSESLLLTGGVSVFHDQGYEFSSPSARLWLKDGRAEGDDPAEAHGPGGEIKSADGFLMIDKGRRILFKGKSRLILRPGENANAPSK